MLQCDTCLHRSVLNASDGDTLRHSSGISEVGTTDEVRDCGSAGNAVCQAAPDSEEALREQPYKAIV